MKDPSVLPMVDVEDAGDGAPSREELLKRAAELGPRMTWASIAITSDPILGQKMQPRVAERRARFRKLVKVALGGCVAFCVVATAASALSSSSPTQSASGTATKTAPATRVPLVEKLELAVHARAPGHASAIAAVRPKAFSLKRH